MKKVTVVIPVYNVEKYIAATVQSVLQQTYQHFELLIVDDGSVDRSLAICREFSDSRIRILHQKNRGPAAARNLGIRASTGDYIAFLDGDDLWLPDKLAKHVKHLERSPKVGLSFCCSAFINEDGKPLGIYQFTKVADITLLDLLCRTPIGNGSVPVMRRSLINDLRFTMPTEQGEEVCYFNPDRSLHPSEDVECWLRILLKTNWQIAGIPEALTLYRINSRGFSANLLKKLESWQQMLIEAQTYAEEIAVYEAPAMSYQLRYLARRAVTLRDGKIAVKLMHRSLETYDRILFEEPLRTLQTLVASYLMCVLPSSFYQGFERAAMRLAGVLQKQQLHRQAQVGCSASQLGTLPQQEAASLGLRKPAPSHPGDRTRLAPSGAAGRRR